MNVLNKKSVLKEFIAILFLGILSTGIAVTIQDYILSENGNLRVLPSIISFLPLLIFYVPLRLFLSSLSSCLIVMITFAIFTEINRVKQALTTEPLSWSDVTALSNFSILQNYLSYQHISLLFLFIGFVLLLVKFKQFRKPKPAGFVLAVLFYFFALPFAFYPYIYDANENLGIQLREKMSEWGVRYYAWDWAGNVKFSGLPLHLIQTSHRKIPSTPNATEVEEFSRLKAQNTPIQKRPQNVIFILCEACWYDKNHFRSEYDAIRKIPFIDFRAVSPTYGGGTVNSSFELLTGLPSHGALNGIIYQEYESIIRQNTLTFPSAMRSMGYATVAAHNHQRKFWRRDLMKPKLGFDLFLSREDMDAHDQKYFADDSILFSRVLKELKERKSPSFYFLTTVYTHGGYANDGDNGQKDYSRRLKKTMSAIGDFVEQALLLQPDTAIMVVGDHKPALTKFFHANGVAPDSIFSKVGERDEDYKYIEKSKPTLIGDMPVLFYHPNNISANKFRELANEKPFYCLANYFDSQFVGVDLPAFNLARKNRLCDNITDENYYSNAKKFPDYIYSLSLLK